MDQDHQLLRRLLTTGTPVEDVNLQDTQVIESSIDLENQFDISDIFSEFMNCYNDNNSTNFQIDSMGGLFTSPTKEEKIDNILTETFKPASRVTGKGLSELLSTRSDINFERDGINIEMSNPKFHTIINDWRLQRGIALQTLRDNFTAKLDSIQNRLDNWDYSRMTEDNLDLVNPSIHETINTETFDKLLDTVAKEVERETLELDLHLSDTEDGFSANQNSECISNDTTIVDSTIIHHIDNENVESDQSAITSDKKNRESSKKPKKCEKKKSTIEGTLARDNQWETNNTYVGDSNISIDNGNGQSKKSRRTNIKGRQSTLASIVNNSGHVELRLEGNSRIPNESASVRAVKSRIFTENLAEQLPESHSMVGFESEIGIVGNDSSKTSTSARVQTPKRKRSNKTNNETLSCNVENDSKISQPVPKRHRKTNILGGNKGQLGIITVDASTQCNLSGNPNMSMEIDNEENRAPSTRDRNTNENREEEIIQNGEERIVRNTGIDVGHRRRPETVRFMLNDDIAKSSDTLSNTSSSVLDTNIGKDGSNCTRSKVSVRFVKGNLYVYNFYDSKSIQLDNSDVENETSSDEDDIDMVDDTDDSVHDCKNVLESNLESIPEEQETIEAQNEDILIIDV